jgi:cobaltochelatase CobS
MAVSRADLEAKGVDELRQMVRSAYPVLTGAFGVRINKEQCIAVLMTDRTADAVRDEIAQVIASPPKPKPAVPPIKATPKPVAAPVAAPPPKLSAEVRIEKATPDSNRYLQPPLDFQKLLEQQIEAEAQKLLQVKLDEQHVLYEQHLAEKEQHFTSIIEDLKRQVNVGGASVVQPTIVATGEMVKIAGKEYPSIGGDANLVPYLDTQFDPSAWRAECKVKGSNRRFIQRFEHVMQALIENGGKTIWMSGPPGCGKTTVFEYIGAMLAWPQIRVQGNKDMSVDDFVGCYVVAGGQMVWVDGPLTLAMRIGAILIVDEVGRFPSECTNILHGVAERNAKGTLTLTMKGGEAVRPHPNFRIVATDNTLGFGDQSGLYPDTRVQDAAFLDRFTVKLTVGYPTAAKERDIIAAKTGINPDLADLLIKIANDTRDAVAEERMVYQISTRKLLAWSEVAVQFGDVAFGFATVILNSVPESDQAVLVEIAQRHLGDQLGGEFAADDAANTATPAPATT